MKTLQVNAQNTDFYNERIKEYIADPASFKPFVREGEIDQTLDEIQHSFPAHNRKVLVETLTNQYHSLGIELNGLVKANIESFSDEKTLAITTGQQIHPGLGPLFVIYKIWTCIDLAKKLKTEHPTFNFVPVFWMASEDHDFEEIKSVRLFNDIFEWETDQSGPVGRMNPASLKELMEKLYERSDKTDGQSDFLNVCKENYSKYSSFAQATHSIVHHFFQESGLVVIEPDDPSFKSLFQKSIYSDIIDHQAIKQINANKTELKEHGLQIPINGRDINHFYILDTLRERIEFENNVFKVLNTDLTFTKSDLEIEIQKHPERFSPNALLRPLYQQTILPCSHYICGTSEIMYWLELNNLMSHQNVIFPHLPLRSSAFIIGEKTLDKFSSLGIELETVFQSDENFIKRHNARHNEITSAIENTVERAISELEKLGQAEASTANSQGFNRKRLKIQQSIEQYKNDLLNEVNASALAQDASSKILKLKHKVFGEKIQERIDHIVRYWDQISYLNADKNRPNFSSCTNLQLIVTK